LRNFDRLETQDYAGTKEVQFMKSDGFIAISRPDARVLVLGTLPGKKSLELNEYYAQPRNVFWRIMGEIFAFSPDLPYADRTLRLNENRIALWDVCASAYRPGSLDAKLSNVVANDFSAFFDEHKAIKLICFNGAKADKLYRSRVLPGLPLPIAQIPTQLLPSTSPAHAAMPFDEKLSRWRTALG
jgi:hypoxanthine-DNA glycosylase